MKIKLFTLAFLTICIVSCRKEGPGGTSSLNGVVMSSEYTNAQAEVTEIICTNGLQLEHGDYWILNTPGQGEYYYIWYDNPTWVTPGDPGLSGRTGISVLFNYSDSNTDIATNTMTELGSNTGTNFSIVVINDVIKITNTALGYTPDADDVTTPFEFNIANQGKDATIASSIPLADERVFLTYGANEYYNDDIFTDPDGEFQFSGLTKGNYSIYVISQDTINGGTEKVAVQVEITSNKSIVIADTLKMLK